MINVGGEIGKKFWFPQLQLEKLSFYFNDELPKKVAAVAATAEANIGGIKCDVCEVARRMCNYKAAAAATTTEQHMKRKSIDIRVVVESKRVLN